MEDIHTATQESVNIIGTVSDSFAEILTDKAPEASFIPEIWQGHKNNGEGFWIALDRLNGLL